MPTATGPYPMMPLSRIFFVDYRYDWHPMPYRPRENRVAIPGPGPRTRAYWEAKLREAERQLVVLREVVEHGVVKPPVPVMKRRLPYRKAYAEWQKSLRAKASAVGRIEMLRMTKMPYYRERILALTPTVWDRLLREPEL